MSLLTKVQNYQLSNEAEQIVKTSRIVLLVGIAGAGKDTLKKKLLANADFCDIVSHTTRPPRVNNDIAEVQDEDYHFIDIETAERMIDERAFVEVKYVHGTTIYGTTVAEIKKGNDVSKISITDIDVQGVAEYKKISANVTAIFLLPPNYDVWRERLSKRYESPAAFEAEWPARRESALRELKNALSVSYYHFIINNQLDRTVSVASEIAHKPETFHRKDDEARLAARNLLDQLEQR